MIRATVTRRGLPGSRTLAHLLAACLLVSAGLGVAPGVLRADDDAAAFRDLATGSDFRVRVAAALALGKSKSPGARPALEKALGDAHPAVRSAAAAALGMLGDARALPALKSALGTEADAGVKSAIERTINRLSTASTSGPAAPAVKPKFLVALGKLENKSGVSTVTAALRTSTRARMAKVPGVEVLADGTDAGAEGKSRNLPAFTVDGTLTKLDKQQGSDNVGYAARVEYLLRKMPDQKLLSTMRGSASAFADAKEIRGQDELAQLQVDAISAAVDSALKSAPPALEAGVK